MTYLKLALALGARLAVLLIVFAAGLAVAQEPAAAPAVPAPLDWNKLLMDLLMGVAALAVTIITGVLLPAARRWMAAKAADQGASAGAKVLLGATLRVEGFIEAGLVQAWSVFEADIKAAAEPDSDGGTKITDGELAKAKADVLEAVKKYLGTAGMAQLTGVLGFGGELLETWLKAQIERKVQAAVAAGSVAAASVTTGRAAAAALSNL